ncbi:FAD/NAD(P)-binding domain-containing protein [Backusella circina FSU 941]|nr:FAD/NAD(P)-binding domain-containing protein [Backusella circina FSU 941]
MFCGNINKTIKRVAVIGAGPGGLAAARALRNENHFETITVYERSDRVGGTWNYSPQTNAPPPIPCTQALTNDHTLEHPKDIFSPIYESLHTNLPHTVMCFKDVPFPEDTPYFPTHRHVLSYVQRFAVEQNLMPMVRLSTQVENVQFEKGVWTVTATNIESGIKSHDEFEAVIVANGHYTIPYIPDVPGLAESETFLEIFHSRDYRTPDRFKDKTLLVIGGGSSASDIVRESSTVATKVYQTIRTETELSRRSVAQNPPNVEQIGLLTSIDPHTKTIHCGDKTLTDIDTIVFATGYLFSFPFLPFQEERHLIKTGQKVYHLNNYLFYNNNPTLSFIGLPIRVVPFPLMQTQAVAVARYLSGKLVMLDHELTPPTKTGDDDDRNEFIMGVGREFDYVEKLGAWAEGWVDESIEDWHSTDRITGRLPEEWKETRKASLILRKEHLGY